MADFQGSMTLTGSQPTTVSVEIHLDTERLSFRSGGVEIGNWSLEDVKVRAALDGLHIVVEGEDMVLHTNDDARLAIAFGIRSAPPLLRRQMAAAMRDEPPAR